MSQLLSTPKSTPHTNASNMPSPDEIFANWHGIVSSDFFTTISKTFELSAHDSYVYRAEGFAMTLSQIQELVDSGKLKYKYQAHGQQIEVSSPPGTLCDRRWSVD
jgi:hypothetical protein